MMSHNKKQLTGNKGVSVTETDIEEMSEINSPRNVTVRDVRNDVKKVIDSMGPETPQNPIKQLTDTEDSSYSTSIYSSIRIKVNEKNNDDSSTMTTYNVSEITEIPPRQTVESAIQTSGRDYYGTNLYNDYNIPPHICPNMVTPNKIIQNFQNTRSKIVKHTSFERSSRFASWLGLKNKKESCNNCSKHCDLYKINIEQPDDDHSPPRRLVFDLMQELPKADVKTIGTNTKQERMAYYCSIAPPKINKNPPVYSQSCHVPQKELRTDEVITETVDIYYFDHGNADYYRTTDSPPVIQTEYIAQRTDYYTKKFWAEFFGTFHIGVSFVVSFILQLVRFFLQGIYRPLVIGLIQLGSDYFLKPSLAVLFNGLIQPPMIFLYNCVTSVRDVCQPIAETVGLFIREVAVMLKSIRLVQIEKKNKEGNECKVRKNKKWCKPAATA